MTTAELLAIYSAATGDDDTEDNAADIAAAVQSVLAAPSDAAAAKVIEWWYDAKDEAPHCLSCTCESTALIVVREMRAAAAEVTR